ncbi:hypothetical protein B1992_10840 [Pseudoxanthomonas broegbernensis]|uniref:Stage II sporulation protein M n=1 Tax=Pseudoxanthomonas broegbernensis TaxID=83619 RepID=A0A7V8K6D0_9GAMM|nr:stage II sporulation protein M [Pseudoxanthomonas broegbernensis]KAF1685688.1 hypothetical protein B1992_10840 [Pseudoxanthomonas broegbernensis]MBB6066033.1 putative membrane protein SpoIIM required for sporulation [Pseudoxanthomonas broegbernensis]
MRQEQFIARHRAEWDAFEQWLQRRGDGPSRTRTAATGAVPDDEIPARYRRLCQQLALARRRGYSPPLLERLQQLMHGGHAALYRAPPPRWRRMLDFLVAGFPLLVRRQGRVMWASAALFALPLAGVFLALQWRPELIHHMLDPAQVAQFERMYDPADPRQTLGRESGGDWQMFGHYVMNNISIGLRTFAGGLLAGVGTIAVLIANGVSIGAVAGHLQAVGHGDPFWRFVAGHAPLELTAIVIAGGAGLRLGLDLVAPGNRRRRDALVDAGRIGARLCLGVAAMLLLAAFVEAFWSSTQSIPAWIKFTVSGVLWALVLGWLWRGGHGAVEDGDAA